jgi:hypothetical protein
VGPAVSVLLYTNKFGFASVTTGPAAAAAASITPGQYPYQTSGLKIAPQNQLAKITSDTTGQDGTRIVVFDDGEKITVSPDASTTTHDGADGTKQASVTTGPAAGVP